MNKRKIGLIIGLLFVFLGVISIGYDRYKTEYDQAIVTTIKEDKINFFYRDDCKDCKKVFNQVYLHNLIKHDVQFINLKQEKNRKYIEEYNIHTVPTFIYKNKVYAGINRHKIGKFLSE